jgi:hypothetical protein
VELEILTALTMQINVFWDVMMCSLADRYNSSTLKMEETIYRATWYHIPDNINHQL